MISSSETPREIYEPDSHQKVFFSDETFSKGCVEYRSPVGSNMSLTVGFRMRQ